MNPAAARFVRRFAPNDVLFSQNQPAVEVFFVLSGEVSLQHEGAQGVLWTGSISSDSFVGEVALMSRSKHMATARAETAVEALALTGSDFEKMLLAVPEVSLRLFQAMAARETFLLQRLATLMTNDPMLRLLQWLGLQIAQGAETLTPNTKLLADTLCMSQADLEAQLSKLIRAKLLTVSTENRLAFAPAAKWAEFYEFYQQRLQNRSS